MNNTLKKSVLYIPDDDDRISEGHPAFLMHVINHTSKLVSNTLPVITSPVLKYDPVMHTIETRNSFYLPYEQQ